MTMAKPTSREPQPRQKGRSNGLTASRSNRSPKIMLNNLAKTPEASSLEAGSDELCLETECRPGRASPEEAGEAQGEVP